MDTESALAYRRAYELQYGENNYNAALMAYENIIARYGASPEAEFAKNQIQIIRSQSLASGLSEPEETPVPDIPITTAPSLEGHQITQTLDIVTAECVYGINLFRDFFAGVSDVFGGRSVATQRVLRDARKACLKELRREAHSIGANAVIAVSLDYSEISGGGKSMLFLVASGTAVEIKPRNAGDD